MEYSKPTRNPLGLVGIVVMIVGGVFFVYYAFHSYALAKSAVWRAIELVFYLPTGWLFLRSAWQWTRGYYIAFSEEGIHFRDVFGRPRMFKWGAVEEVRCARHGKNRMVPDLEGIVSSLSCSAEGRTLRFPASIDLTDACETILNHVPESTTKTEMGNGDRWKDATRKLTRIFKKERPSDAA